MAINIPIRDITINGILSLLAFYLTLKLIPGLSPMFIKANLYGTDMNKISKKPVAEAVGVVCAAVYLISMFVFLPFPFLDHLSHRHTITFPFDEYVEYLAALLSVCCMVALGFADDVLDLRWRHKLLLPTISSLPLLLVYFITFDLTVVVVPSPLVPLLGHSVDIGLLYYVYMGMLAVFCTNAINIVAGINGIEAGQSLVIALSVITFNLMEMKGECQRAHLFSLYFLTPFTAVTLALLWYNRYPSRVFVGDTFCYFSGMTFAVVAILGHFSKTLLLFFIPQVFNFLFSIPQLFHLVPCPRHRLPRFDPNTGCLFPSTVKFKRSSTGLLGRLAVHVFSTLRLIDVKEDEEWTECTNMTIINYALRLLGPMHEASLTLTLLSLQVSCSAVALVIRYPLARFLYDS